MFHNLLELDGLVCIAIILVLLSWGWVRSCPARAVRSLVAGVGLQP